MSVSIALDLIHKNEDIDRDVQYIIRCTWCNWRAAIQKLCD